MTTIRVFRNSDGQTFGYEVSGHAGSVPAGDIDLVCCAVSVLAETGVNALETVAGIRAHVDMRDGYLLCLLPKHVTAEQNENAQKVFLTILTGFEGIKESYPDLIRMHVEERRPIK